MPSISDQQAHHIAVLDERIESIGDLAKAPVELLRLVHPSDIVSSQSMFAVREHCLLPVVGDPEKRPLRATVDNLFLVIEI